ncbi:MAG TPA: 1-deoxy-D-xylulose-5-phosphate reductoisomerase [Synergistaceae bacterium]|nr:1-deoxy-D-xylulose-5-phosphate reductoisomerase [Synergistaceae bacterium]HQA54412.1 1-deoxy-D-xylulose-5-phosphate reductoisomerase [Synergistaceae bacterium]
MSTKKIRVAVIGATGSVGGAVLDICRRFPERFEVVALAAKSNEAKLTELASLHRARTLCLTEPRTASFKAEGYNCLTGTEALSLIASDPDIDHIVFASSGVAAIKALQTALREDKDVSLANKESIVVAGPWVMPLVKRTDQLRPVDSEHSAIWQCIREENKAEIQKIWLTASGGPFRNYTREMLEKVTPEEALAHPVWKMGPKITVDSATLMNKGIECIEAMQLFDLPAEKVSALVHPGSQVHGVVLFYDGTMKLLASSPDMRLPAAAALAWPDRVDLVGSGLDFSDPAKWDLSFREIDGSLFPCFGIACKAGEMGGAYPSLLVGADEAAVRAFIDGMIPFTAIPLIIEETLSGYSSVPPASLDEAVSMVGEGEAAAWRLCKNWRYRN